MLKTRGRKFLYETSLSGFVIIRFTFLITIIMFGILMMQKIFRDSKKQSFNDSGYMVIVSFLISPCTISVVITEWGVKNTKYTVTAAMERMNVPIINFRVTAFEFLIILFTSLFLSFFPKHFSEIYDVHFFFSLESNIFYRKQFPNTLHLHSE